MGLLAEIQKVSVLFIGLSFEGDGVKAPSMKAWVNGNSGLSESSNERNRGADTVEGVVSTESVEKLSILQASFSLMQIVVARHQGVIKELSVDDKGTVSIFGKLFGSVFGIGIDLLVTGRVAAMVFYRSSRFYGEFHLVGESVLYGWRECIVWLFSRNIVNKSMHWKGSENL